jgi:hypothetical protein
MARTRTGKNKTNCSGILEMSKKLNKLSEYQRIQLVTAKNNNISLNDFHKYISEQVTISYSAIVQIYQREKDTILLNLSKEEIDKISFEIFEIFNK